MATFFRLLLFVSVIFIATARQQQQTNITLNSSLTPTSNPPSWQSPSRLFSFGFYPQANGFAVGVWLAGPSGESIVVWTANRDNPPVAADSILLVSSDGRLLLRSRGQDTPISNVSEAASSASILDSGNFVLYNSNSRIIWQTFDSPTDTLLAGQSLLAGRELFSSVSETNHSTGRFRFKMQNDGNLVLYPVHTMDIPGDSIWSTFTQTQGNNVSLHLSNNGRIFMINSTGFNIKNITDNLNPPSGATVAIIYRAMLDFGGIFKLYSHGFDRNGNSTMTEEWPKTRNHCEVKGFCGINSYCTQIDTEANCTCPRGFDFIDQGQKFRGCVGNFIEEGCSGKKGTVTYDIDSIKNTLWEDNPYSSLSVRSEEECRDACLQDCNCEAAMFRDTACGKQKLPLRYGRRNLDNSTTFLIKYGTDSSAGPHGPHGSDETNPIARKGDNKSKRKRRMIAATTGAGIFFLTCVLVFMVLLIRKLPLDNSMFFWKKKTHETRNVEAFLENNSSRLPKRYRYFELKKMTDFFKDNLGQGGYGSVFKGKLKDGPPVAVKVLNKSNEGNGEEFLNEVASISRTRHVNVVELLGFCFEGSKRALVYEFMSNGSLDKFIYTEKQGTRNILNCQKLHDIALGIARGLEYLHRGCNTRILHLDIKPHNILLDDNFCPKISDFGLAKLCPGQESTISMLEARGTIGYTAPEVFCKSIGGVSHKSDVYSYGMVVLEMIGGRKNIDARVHNTSEIYFPHWVHKHINLEGSQGLFGFRSDEEEEIARKMVMVGLWCIQTDPTNRPSMSKVVEMLEGSLGSLEMPPKPYLSSPTRSCSSPT